MATILLQSAGGVIGGFLGPLGSSMGRAVGAMSGYLIDQAIFGSEKKDHASFDPGGTKFFSAEEGTALPKIYGTMRISGSIIWMTRFQQHRERERQTGKGSTSSHIAKDSYLGNVAFALCEGEISGVRRIWADGVEIDHQHYTIRVYKGTENEKPDPLIEAVQGVGHVPCYRGVAYVVFEQFNLAPYGNRIPQMQFEVLRPVGSIYQDIRSVVLIPGATEYGLSTNLVCQMKQPGAEQAVNRHILFAPTDLDAALDELKMLCPKLENVALVVTWFGDDLRSSFCKIRPAVTHSSVDNYSNLWSVRGVTRLFAYQITHHDDKPAYGGSPSDESVKQAIRAIKERGFNVTLYPFIMMDIPDHNEKRDPYGAKFQASYPWRGRITCDPAPNQVGSVEKTHIARLQIMQFCGKGDINSEDDEKDWNYRSFILHLAHLASQAGGVETFLIGSELRGLTTVRDENNHFPFVEELCLLAEDVRAILGKDTKITYGADWSEYFGYHPSDGSNDVFFHLDLLWSHVAIDAIGIDNYMPLSDWRDVDYDGNNPDAFFSPYDIDSLGSMIARGEGFDWFYPSYDHREKRERKEISDQLYRKPWIYRYKDLVSWWENLHYNRIGGIEQKKSTTWIPKSKPIWFTEIGCPAVDNGPNQPNVFVDSKSSETALPYFSSGSRSDIASRSFLKAHLQYWNPKASNFSLKNNPVSDIYGGHMVDFSRIYLWAWDSRPFPAFPSYSSVWSDSVNWRLGHWLNGKLNSIELGDLINAILRDYGLKTANVSSTSGLVSGYILPDNFSARKVLEPLLDLFGIYVKQEGENLVFFDHFSCKKSKQVDQISFEENSFIKQIIRIPDHQLPSLVTLSFRDPDRDFQSGLARYKKSNIAHTNQKNFFFSGALEEEEAQRLLCNLLARLWLHRTSISFSIPVFATDILPGSILSLGSLGIEGNFLVEKVEEGRIRRVFVSSVLSRPVALSRTIIERKTQVPEIYAGSPLVCFLDLPLMPGDMNPVDQFRCAIWKKPWKTQLAYVSAELTGFQKRKTIDHPASMGVLLSALEPAEISGRIDYHTILKVDLFNGSLSNISMTQMLNGQNIAAVFSKNSAWEIIQFQFAKEIEPGKWDLKNLLRGQLGTEDCMHVGAKEGSYFIILDDSVVPAGVHNQEIGLPLNWKFIPEGADISSFTETISLHYNARALRPLSPVHLRCQESTSGIYEFKWIRRTRLHGDDWETENIPLGEEHEEYYIEIKKLDGKFLRSASVMQPSYSCSKEDLSQNEKLPFTIHVTVLQKGTGGRLGIPITRQFFIA